MSPASQFVGSCDEASAPVSARFATIAQKEMQPPPSVSSVTLYYPAVAMPSASARDTLSSGNRSSMRARASGHLWGPHPPSAIRPMICTAMTFTIVAEGKIIA